MHFLHPEQDSHKELTFADLFILQQYSEISSRRNIDLTPQTPLSTTLPIISANMNSVTGKRMSETLARYGGMGVLPQDMSLEKILEIINFIHNADIKFDTALTMSHNSNIREARGIIGKRDHDAVIIVDENSFPQRIITNSDIKLDQEYAKLGDIRKKRELITGKGNISYEEAYNAMNKVNISSLPIIDSEGKLKGMLTKKDAVRGDMYTPSLNKNKQLNVSVALGINGYRDKIDALLESGIDTIVLDTAHGLQKSMINSISEVRNIVGDHIQIIAGNICSAEGVKHLMGAGADGVKVGIGPGAMCTTRMQTGVGRPQFSAVKECADEMKQYNGYVWADGGIKEPRDLALAIAAGASHAMIGSILAGTHESTGDIKEDGNGNKYKESHGMASSKAVLNRNKDISPIEQARRDMYNEGISTSKVYMKSGRSSVGDLLDEFTTGLRSTMAYTGAESIAEYQEKVIVGVQSNAGFAEGKPHKTL